MLTLAELKQAIIEEKELIWDDSDPINDNDYTISYIEDLSNINETDIEDFPIYIEYNNGDSEANVLLSEIKYKHAMLQ